MRSTKLLRCFSKGAFMKKNNKRLLAAMLGAFGVITLSAVLLIPDIRIVGHGINDNVPQATKVIQHNGEIILK